MNIIEINESNYQSYTNLDIAAFSFAYEGAMGEGGAIYIIDTAGNIYHANYFRGDYCIEKNHIKDIIPIFEDLQFRMFGIETDNENWVAVNLGFGNSLLVTKTISDAFNKKVEGANFERSGQLFQHWPGFVSGLLGKGDSALTMNDIWEMQR